MKSIVEVFPKAPKSDLTHLFMYFTSWPSLLVFTHRVVYPFDSLSTSANSIHRMIWNSPEKNEMMSQSFWDIPKKTSEHISCDSTHPMWNMWNMWNMTPPPSLEGSHGVQLPPGLARAANSWRRCPRSACRCSKTAGASWARHPPSRSGRKLEGLEGGGSTLNG